MQNQKREDPVVAVDGGLRTKAEQEEASLNQECFDRNPEPWDKKLENFPKYVRRQNITRFLALYEIFKRVLPVKGSIVECGVFPWFRHDELVKIQCHHGAHESDSPNIRF